MLAQAMAPIVQPRHACVVFASGVSNSTETDPAAFAREEALLREHLEDPRTLLYFSSCGVADEHEARRPYILHKRAMEDLVRAHGGRIVRLPQVVGRTDNPHTLTNYLRDRILRGEHFDLWANRRAQPRRRRRCRAHRRRVAGRLAAGHAHRHDRMPGVHADAAHRRGVRTRARSQGELHVVDLGRPMPVDTALARGIAQRIGIDFDAGYLERVIGKYYG